MAEDVFTGGLRRGWFNATWPFARLTLADSELVIRLFGVVNVRSDWGGVATAQRVVGGLTGSPGLGVRITLTNGLRVVFWTFRPARVLMALKARGVSVV
jgi:hypothetical protein